MTALPASKYKALSGAPLLSLGAEPNRGVSCFFMQGNRLVFLRRSDYPEVLLRPVCYSVERQLEPTPAPDAGMRSRR